MNIHAALFKLTMLAVLNANRLKQEKSVERFAVLIGQSPDMTLNKLSGKKDIGLDELRVICDDLNIQLGHLVHTVDLMLLGPALVGHKGNVLNTKELISYLRGAWKVQGNTEPLIGARGDLFNIHQYPTVETFFKKIILTTK